MADSSMTLDDVTLELMESNSNLVRLDNNIKMVGSYLNDTNANTWATFEILNDIKEIMSGGKLAEIEQAREAGAVQEKILDALENIDSNTKKEKLAKEMDLDIGPLKYIAGLAGLLAGVAAGFVAQQVKMIAGFAKLLWSGIRFLGKGIRNVLLGALAMFKDTKVGSYLLGIADNIKLFFRNLLLNVSTFVKNNPVGKFIIEKLSTLRSFIRTSFTSAITAITERFSRIVEGVKDIGRAIGGLATRVKELIKPFFTAATGFDEFKNGAMKVLTRIRSFGTSIMKSMGAFGTIFRTVGKFAFFIGARVIAPLITAFDVVTGAIDGFKKDGIIGGLIGGVKGFFKQFGELGNLILGAVAWIAKKLGFEDFAKTLKGIDIVKIINGAIDSIVNWFKLLFKDPVGALSKMWDGVVDVAKWVGGAIGKAWEWFKGLFKFGDEDKKVDGEDTSGGILSIISKSLSSAWNWIKNLFSFSDKDVSNSVTMKFAKFVGESAISAWNWVKGLFGFGDSDKKVEGEETSGGIIALISRGVTSAFKWVKSLFTFSEDQMNSSGMFSKLIDIVTAPLNLAINFVKGLFNWGDPEKPFSLGTFITEQINKAWEWIKGLFTFNSSELGGKKDEEKGPSLASIAGEALSRVWKYIKELFTSIDFGAIAKAILPESLAKAADKVMSWFKKDEKTGSAGAGQENAISIPANATPEEKLAVISKISNETGQVLKDTASAKADTETADAVRNSVALQTTAASSNNSKGSSNFSNSSDNSSVTINNGNMPDRTDSFSVGGFGVSP